MGAIDASRGFLDFDPDEAAFERAALDRARRLAVVSDHGKFSHAGTIHVADLEHVHNLVTERNPPPAIREAAARLPFAEYLPQLRTYCSKAVAAPLSGARMMAKSPGIVGDAVSRTGDGRRPSCSPEGNSGHALAKRENSPLQYHVGIYSRPLLTRSKMSAKRGARPVVSCRLASWEDRTRLRPAAGLCKLPVSRGNGR